VKFRGEWEGRKQRERREREGEKKRKEKRKGVRKVFFLSFFPFFFFLFEDHVGGGVTLGPPHYWLWWWWCGGGPDRGTLKKPHKMFASGNSSIGKKLSSRLSNPSVTEFWHGQSLYEYRQVNEYRT